MLVDQIIAAKKAYDESDRPWLSKLADGQLKKIAASCGCTAEPATPAAATTPEPAPAAATPDSAPVASAAAPTVTPPTTTPVVAAAAAPAEPEKPLTADQWLEKTPDHLREMFGGLLANRRASEAALREKIVAQSSGALTKEYLADKPLEELETLAAATARPAADYSGRAVQGHDPIAQAGKPATAPRMPGIKIGPAAA